MHLSEAMDLLDISEATLQDQKYTFAALEFSISAQKYGSSIKVLKLPSTNNSIFITTYWTCEKSRFKKHSHSTKKQSKFLRSFTYRADKQD